MQIYDLSKSRLCPKAAPSRPNPMWKWTMFSIYCTPTLFVCWMKHVVRKDNIYWISAHNVTKQIRTVASVNIIRIFPLGIRMLPAAAARPWATLIPRVNIRIMLTSEPVKICIMLINEFIVSLNLHEMRLFQRMMWQNKFGLSPRSWPWSLWSIYV